MMIRYGIWCVLTPILLACAVYSQAQVNNPLRQELLDMREADQLLRMKIRSAIKEHGLDSPEIRVIWEEQNHLDETNLARLKAIVAEHGWPGETIAGQDGAIAAWLVLQHADYDSQIEYLPMVKAAVSDGELKPNYLALLQDRILVSQGKPQIYGSQLRSINTSGQMEPYPIEDEVNVDERRAKLGMVPLAEYVERARRDP